MFFQLPKFVEETRPKGKNNFPIITKLFISEGAQNLPNSGLSLQCVSIIKAFAFIIDVSLPVQWPTSTPPPMRICPGPIYAQQTAIWVLFPVALLPFCLPEDVKVTTWLLKWFVVVENLKCVLLFVTPWTTAHQASLSLTISRSSPKFMSIELMMPSNHLFSHSLIFSFNKGI